MGIMNGMIKTARVVILVIVIAGFAAGIFTLWYMAQPDILEMMTEGGYPVAFSFFFMVWGLASMLVTIVWACATRSISSVPNTIASE